MSTINELRRWRVQVALVGIDTEMRPVLFVKDVRREMHMAVRRDGSGVESRAVRFFTDEEVENMNPLSCTELLSLGLHTQSQEASP